MNTQLSVNVNKIATLRNSRGGNNPDLVRMTLDCQRFGAQGITVHPRPDERHIRYQDVRDIRPLLSVEFNIEGNPQEPRFGELVLETRPDQVTLVPDAPGQITSNHGWEVDRHLDFLKEWISRFQQAGIRVSIFMDPRPEAMEAAARTGTDRIELYTESYARGFAEDPAAAVRPYREAAIRARELGLEVNAGHDLDRNNLGYFLEQVPGVKEVSIGHALISDALYYGIENTIQMYLRAMERSGNKPLPS